jgi:hypothetical protein
MDFAQTSGKPAGVLRRNSAACRAQAGFFGVSRGSKMGIRFLCPNGHKLNVKMELAGKRAMCPDCGAKLVVPAVGNAPSESSLHNLSAVGHVAVAPAPSHGIVVGPSPAAVPQAIVWYVHSESGDQSGPLEGNDLAKWIGDGRVTAETYLWRVGWPDWRTAGDASHELPVSLPSTAILTAPAADIREAAVPAISPAAAEGLRVLGSGIGSDPEPRTLNPEPLPDPRTANPQPAVPDDLAALPNASIRRPRQQTPIVVTILLIFTIVILVGVLIWVIRRNGSSDSPAPQAAPIPVAEPRERS